MSSNDTKCFCEYLSAMKVQVHFLRYLFHKLMQEKHAERHGNNLQELLKDELRKTTNQCETLDLGIQELQRDIESLSEKVSKMWSQCEQDQQLIESLTEANENRLAQIFGLQRDNEQNCQNIAQLTNENAAMKTHVGQLLTDGREEDRHQIEILTREISCLKSELHRLKLFMYDLRTNGNKEKQPTAQLSSEPSGTFHSTLGPQEFKAIHASPFSETSIPPLITNSDRSTSMTTTDSTSETALPSSASFSNSSLSSDGTSNWYELDGDIVEDRDTALTHVTTQRNFPSRLLDSVTEWCYYVFMGLTYPFLPTPPIP